MLPGEGWLVRSFVCALRISSAGATAGDKEPASAECLFQRPAAAPGMSANRVESTRSASFWMPTIRGCGIPLARS